MATTDLERLVVSLEANAKKFEREMERARQTTDKSMYALDKRLDSSLSKVEGKLGRIGSSIRTGLAGALAGVSLASLTALSDSFTKIQNQLKVGGLEGDALARTYQSLYEIAQKQGAPLEALATLYGRVSGAQKELNTNSAEMLRFTNAVGLALKVNGTSATESSGALLQLAQALGGGKIQAEEFNSLIDGARPLLQAAAGGIEEAGGSVAKLTALVKDGKVSSEAFFRGVLAGTPILDRLAATTKETSEQGLTRLRNSLISLVGALDESTGASQNAATSLSNFASGVDSIASRVPGAVAELKTLAKAFYDTAQSYANSFGNLPIFENLAKKYADPAAIKRVERSMNREAGKADAPVGSAPEGIDILRKAMQAQAAARGTPAKPAATKPNMFDEYDAMTAKALAPKTISLKDYKVPEEKKEKAGGGGGGGKSSAEKVTDYKRETDAIEKRTRAFDSEREAIGKSALEVAQAEGKFRLMEAAQKAGVPVTQQLTQDVDRLSLAYARAKVALDEAEEKQRSFEGASRQAGAMLSDGFKDAVLEGEKLNVVLDRLLKSIGSKGFDSFFDTLFGKEGPGTNLLKSVFSSFSGGKGFAAGGYTGPGRKNDPRGVVHAGEVVWSQADIRRAGGVGTVEAMRRGARGYAGGGIVGGTLVPMSPGRIAPMGGRARTAAPVNVTTNINALNSDAAGLARLERIVREQEASLPKRLWEIQRRNS